MPVKWADLKPATKDRIRAQRRANYAVRKAVAAQIRAEADTGWKCTLCMIGSHAQCKPLFIVTVHANGERTPTQTACECGHGH